MKLESKTSILMFNRKLSRIMRDLSLRERLSLDWRSVLISEIKMDSHDLAILKSLKSKSVDTIQGHVGNMVKHGGRFFIQKSEDGRLQLVSRLRRGNDGIGICHCQGFFRDCDWGWASVT